MGEAVEEVHHQAATRAKDAVELLQGICIERVEDRQVRTPLLTIQSND